MPKALLTFLFILLLFSLAMAQETLPVRRRRQNFKAN